MLKTCESILTISIPDFQIFQNLSKVEVSVYRFSKAIGDILALVLLSVLCFFRSCVADHGKSWP